MKIFNIFKKHRVTLIYDDWEIVKSNVKVKYIPRIDELIFLPEHNKYFNIINVMYNFVDSQEVYIIIEERK